MRESNRLVAECVIASRDDDLPNKKWEEVCLCVCIQIAINCEASSGIDFVTLSLKITTNNIFWVDYSLSFGNPMMRMIFVFVWLSEHTYKFKPSQHVLYFWEIPCSMPRWFFSSSREHHHFFSREEKRVQNGASCLFNLKWFNLLGARRRLQGKMQEFFLTLLLLKPFSSSWWLTRDRLDPPPPPAGLFIIQYAINRQREKKLSDAKSP